MSTGGKNNEVHHITVPQYEVMALKDIASLSNTYRTDLIGISNLKDRKIT